jgi:hypothetical protein
MQGRGGKFRTAYNFTTFVFPCFIWGAVYRATISDGWTQPATDYELCFAGIVNVIIGTMVIMFIDSCFAINY